MMRRLLALGWIAGTILPFACYAFANVKPGEVVENVQLPTVAGGKEWLLGKEKANIFVFFKPAQEHSETTLLEMAKCEKEFAGKSVHWAAVVSGHFSKDEVKAAVAKAGIAMPVLVDDGDTLYGKLGIALHPVIGITDQKQKLFAYEPFRKINYCDVVRARIRFLLGEINEEQMQAVVAPPAATQGGENQVARRYMKLGERQLKNGELDKAKENAKRALEHDANLAAAHSLMGAVLAAEKNCAEAVKSFDKALSIDPQDAAALEGKQGCATP